MSKIKELEGDELKNKIKEGRILVDFWADWCGPCKQLGSILESVSEKTEVQIVKADVEKNQEFVSTLGIRSVPTMVLFDNGEEVNRIIGLVNEDSILNTIG